MSLNISVNQQNYGPLKFGFNFNISDGYNVLVGKNDSGKSSILQYTFKSLFELQEIGNDRFCLLNPERLFIEPTLETGGLNLEQYNRQMYNLIMSSTLAYHSLQYSSSNAFKLLITNHRQRLQLNSSDQLLERLGFSNLDITQASQVIIDEINIGNHGSGLRTILPIIAVLTDPNIKYVLIDEPEQSLEPSIQKYVREMLYEASSSKTIVVATHSHLFLNRNNISFNYKVSRNTEKVSIKAIESDLEIYDLVYKLLGSSPEDLFFPKNFIVVEGASDQKIIEKIVQLKGYKKWDVKIISARSISTVESYKDAFESCLTPYILSESYYKDKVVVLVDQPNEQIIPTVEELKRVLGTRLIELPNLSLEEYLPETLYSKAGRNKSNDVSKLEELRSNYPELKILKTNISNEISEIITVDDLNSLKVITDAIDKAVLI